MDDPAILTGLAAAPIIAALVEVVRRAFSFADRLIPLVTVLTGIVWVAGSAYAAGEFAVSTIFLGAVVGLAASGLYNVAKPPAPAAQSGATNTVP